METFLIIVLATTTLIFWVRYTWKCQEIDDQKMRHEHIFDRLCKDKTEEFDHLKREMQAELQQMQDDLNQKIKSANDKEEYYTKVLSDIDKILKEKCNYYPHLAAMMADLLTVYYERSAKYLETKSRPAYIEAYRIRELKQDTEIIISQKKELEYKMGYIRTLIPDIDQIFNMDFDHAQLSVVSVKDILTSAKYKTDDQTAEYIRLIEVTIPSLKGLPFANMPEDFLKSIENGRLNQAIKDNLDWSDYIKIEANVPSSRNSNEFYHVTLNSCTCPYKKKHTEPCKHMEYLAYITGVLFLNKESVAKSADDKLFELHSTMNELADKIKEVEKKERSAEKKLQNAISQSEKIVLEAKIKAKEIKDKAKQNTKSKH